MTGAVFGTFAWTPQGAHANASTHHRLKKVVDGTERQAANEKLGSPPRQHELRPRGLVVRGVGYRVERR